MQGALDAPAAAAEEAEAGKSSTSSSTADAAGNGGASDKGNDKKGLFTEKHHGLLLRLVADELGAEPGDIVDFELNVCDTHAGVIGGA